MEFHVLQGDITAHPVDAIVNAANAQLAGGGGVDGAIHRAGGPSILKECKEIVKDRGLLPTGAAVHTGAGNLPARHVIHTVGPVYQQVGKDAPRLLSLAYQNSLYLADELSCKSVSFPNISTGVYGYPKKEAAKVAIGAVKQVESSLKNVQEIFFICFDKENYQWYMKHL